VGSRGNIIGSEALAPIMKEIDDTPLPKSESEVSLEVWFEVMDRLEARIEELESRISNLEVQRTPADNNMDDPEWY